MIKKTALAMALALALVPFAHATDTAPTEADTTTASKREKAQDLDAVSVIGTGESRQVQRSRPQDQKSLPPGTSLQKVLNTLPGVNAQSVDALGSNEQSMTLSLRGFSRPIAVFDVTGLKSARVHS